MSRTCFRLMKGVGLYGVVAYSGAECAASSERGQRHAQRQG